METLVVCTVLILGAAMFVGICFMALIGEIRRLPDLTWERFVMGQRAEADHAAQAKRESLG